MFSFEMYPHGLMVEDAGAFCVSSSLRNDVSSYNYKLELISKPYLCDKHEVLPKFVPQQRVVHHQNWTSADWELC